MKDFLGIEHSRSSYAAIRTPVAVNLGNPFAIVVHEQPVLAMHAWQLERKRGLHVDVVNALSNQLAIGFTLLNLGFSVDLANLVCAYFDARYLVHFTSSVRTRFWGSPGATWRIRHG